MPTWWAVTWTWSGVWTRPRVFDEESDAREWLAWIEGEHPAAYAVMYRLEGER